MPSRATIFSYAAACRRRPRAAAYVETHLDHRIAMSFLRPRPRLEQADDRRRCDDDRHQLPELFAADIGKLGAALVVIVAIDGPAASGKGTLAKRLAAAYGLPHLDTGLLYRATARAVLDAGEPIDDRLRPPFARRRRSTPAGARRDAAARQGDGRGGLRRGRGAGRSARRCSRPSGPSPPATGGAVLDWPRHRHGDLPARRG